MRWDCLETTPRGVLATVSDRTGWDDELLAWAEEVGVERILEIADGGELLDVYFEALYEDEQFSEDAIEAIGGDDAYRRHVGLPIDRVEDAFSEWLELRELCRPVSREPRGRHSGLAERALVVA